MRRPDLLVQMSNRALICNVTVVDTLADSSLALAGQGRPSWRTRRHARMVDKPMLAADTMRPVHLPFAVETTGRLSESARQLIRQMRRSAGSHSTCRDADVNSTQLVDAVAIAEQRCTALHGHGAAGEPGETAGGSAEARAAQASAEGVSVVAAAAYSASTLDVVVYWKELQCTIDTDPYVHTRRSRLFAWME